MPEEIIPPVNNGYKDIKVTVSGAVSYTAGGTEIVVNSVSKIVEVLSIDISKNMGAYAIQRDKIPKPTGNKITVPIYIAAASTTDGTISYTEVTAGTDLSGETITIVLRGI